MESNFALRQLVGEDNFYGGVSETEAYLTKRVVNALQAGAVHSASLKI
jgi:NADH-quinone oxidoreductase subunit G